MAAHRIERVEVLPVSLPVRSEDEPARRAQQHIFLRVETNRGAVGWGEARALPSWTGETAESITSSLRDYFAPVLLGVDPFARNAVMAAMNEIVTGAVSNGMPSAKAAVDTAVHDLQGQIAGIPIHALFGGRIRERVYLSASVRADTPETMREEAAQHAACRCLKVKLTGDSGLDAERLAACEEAAPNAEIWLDANQRYSPSKALRLIERLRDSSRVACLQQPGPSTDWFGMARLRDRSPLPIAVDEGCFQPHEVLRLASLGVADLVVLKLCKAGGLRPMLSIAELARQAGLELLGSGLTESGIGLAAALHVYCTLDLRLPPQLNGPQFLDELLVEGLEISGTEIKVPSGPGLGVTVNEPRLRALAALGE